MIRLLSGLNSEDICQELLLAGLADEDARLPHLLLQFPAILIPAAIARDMQLPDSNSYNCYIARGSRGTVFLSCTGDTPEHLAGKLAEMQPPDSPANAALHHFVHSLTAQNRRLIARGRELLLDRVRIMGILNVTPDSFSDGGQFLDPDLAWARAQTMIEQGADIIDIGGESSRPGAADMPVEEEWQRVAPVIERLSKCDCMLSIDTRKAGIARRALQAGVHMVNDISSLRFDPDLAAVVAEWQVPLVLMHMQGQPHSMQQNPTYQHLISEVLTTLQERCEAAERAGITQLIVDPGIGFGKRWQDNFELVRRLDELRVLGKPLMLGTSRKSFIGKILNTLPEERLTGSLISNLYGILNGAAILRVHDVLETRRMLDIQQAIASSKADWSGNIPE